jgi:hypothetical protein
VGKVARSTLSDANARRPAGVFAETFAMLAGALKDEAELTKALGKLLNKK